MAPIRGLTENTRIPRLGKIRTGDRSGTNSAPKNLHHFVVPSEVATVYGPTPVSLPIVFLSNDPELIANQYYRAYNRTNGLICRGDGEAADAVLDAEKISETGEWPPSSLEVWASGQSRNLINRRIPCLGKGYGEAPPCPMYAAGNCGEKLFLQFAVMGVPGIGNYQLDTGSIYSILNINGTLEAVRMLTGGKVAGIPMRLFREPVNAKVNGRQMEIWVVSLKVDVPIADLMMRVQQAPGMALLEAPDETEAPADFHPQERPERAAPAAPAEPGEMLSGDQLRAITAGIAQLRDHLDGPGLGAFLQGLAETYSEGHSFIANRLTGQQAESVLGAIHDRLEAGEEPIDRPGPD